MKNKNMEPKNNVDNSENENTIKLYLEACLRKRVDDLQFENLKLEKGGNPKSEKSDIAYRVWLYSSDIFADFLGKDKIDCYAKTTSSSSKVYKFKLGLIDIDELKKLNTNLANERKRTDYLVIIYAHLLVGRHYQSSSDIINMNQTDAEMTRNNIDDQNPTYNQTEGTGRNNALGVPEHEFTFKDLRKIITLYKISFKYDTEEIKCSACEEETVNLIYCHNDQKYFCSTCDENYHEKTQFTVLRKHRRTNYLSFSINYQSTCKDHIQKPYEFYCKTCRHVYCIKCLDNDKHSKKYDRHEIFFVNEFYPKVIQELVVLSEKVKMMCLTIDSEIEQKEKEGRDMNLVVKAHEDGLAERWSKAFLELDAEVLSRCTYLASLSMELQRIISEIDSKIIFLKNQYHNADNSTYINMRNVFESYMRNELFSNLELLMNINLDSLAGTIHTLEKKEPENKV